MYGLLPLDAVVVAVVFGLILAVGLWSARRTRGMKDFILPHRFGPLPMMMFAFGAGTHADQAGGVVSKSFTSGLSGIWYQWLYLFATPFYWLIAPALRRFRALTTSDIYELRFSPRFGLLYTLFGVAQMVVAIAVMLRTSAVIIAGCTGGALPAGLAIAVMVGMVLIYGVCGGLSAAILTDLVQGVLTILFSFMLLPPILRAVGGIAGLRAALPAGKLAFTMPGDISVFYVVMLALVGLIGIVPQPHVLGACAAGRSEKDGRLGFTLGNFLKRFCTIAWCLTGVAAAAYYLPHGPGAAALSGGGGGGAGAGGASGGGGVEPDQVFGLVAHEFLPRMWPGLMGVFVAALLASVMSGCSALMVSAAGLFANNFYKKVLPGRSERQYLWAVRGAAVGMAGLAVLVAYALPGVVAGLELFLEVASIMGVAFWLGFFWRRYTVAGAWATTLGACALWIAVKSPALAGPLAAHPFFAGLTTLRKGVPALSLPWQYLTYLLSGALLGIFVSLCTRHPEPAKLDRFYVLLATPARPGEPNPATPCTFPDGVVPQTPRYLFPPVGGLHVLRPNAVTVLGFAGAWGLVGLLIGALYCIVR